MHRRTNSTCSQDQVYHEKVEKEKTKLVDEINTAFHIIDEAVGNAVKSMIRIGNDLFEFEIPPPEPKDYPEVIPVFQDSESSETYTTETYTTETCTTETYTTETHSPESYTEASTTLTTEWSALTSEGSTEWLDVSDLEESQ